jgi:hypothetical protein
MMDGMWNMMSGMGWEMGFVSLLMLFSVELTHDSGLPRHCPPRQYIGPECATKSHSRPPAIYP